MTHANVLATVSAVMTIVPDLGNRDIYLAYLPMAHILELAAEVRAMGSTLLFGLNKYFHSRDVVFSLF